jgi:predicted nucleic acid-binding protein
MAQTGGADYLVTGDKRAGLLALKTFGRTQIVTPTEFIAAIGDYTKVR